MESSEAKLFVKVVKYSVLSIIGLIVLLGSWTIVSAGDVGVITRVGAVNRIVQAGIHIKIPLLEGVHKMDIQTQKEQADAEAASSDLQTVHSTIAVNYNLDPQHVGELYSQIGESYSYRVIQPAIQESVKAATAKYTAEELITKRSQVAEDIQASLAQRLGTQFIKVTGVSIVHFDFSKTFNDAIEAKVTAEQNALASKNLLEQKKYEAEQTIVTAKAQAEAIQIQAQAINSQGGADYVKLQLVKAWDGKGCTSYCGLEASTGLLITGK